VTQTVSSLGREVAAYRRRYRAFPDQIVVLKIPNDSTLKMGDHAGEEAVLGNAAPPKMELDDKTTTGFVNWFRALPQVTNELSAALHELVYCLSKFE